jgi:hypothetical protein
MRAHAALRLYSIHECGRHLCSSNGSQVRQGGTHLQVWPVSRVGAHAPLSHLPETHSASAPGLYARRYKTAGTRHGYHSNAQQLAGFTGSSKQLQACDSTPSEGSSVCPTQLWLAQSRDMIQNG